MVMPLLFWIVRRLENAIQYFCGARKLAKLSYGSITEENPKNLPIILESVIGIFEESQTNSQLKTIGLKLKFFIGMTISKSFYFGIIVGFVSSLDQIKSSAFRCRKFKNGTEFLLTNDTKAADYLRINFTQIFDMKKKNGEGKSWIDDPVNGLLSEYGVSTYYNYIDYTPIPAKFKQRLDSIADLIEEYNVHGFHDVCNVLFRYNVTSEFHLPPWFERKNATGEFI